MDNTTFKTQNIDLAAFMITKGDEISNVCFSKSGIATFSFKTDPRTDRWQEFLSGDLVPAKSMCNALRECKRIVFSKRKDLENE